MNNLYFIESDSFNLIIVKVKEILAKRQIDFDNLVIYDMEETNISSAIMDLDTYSLFNEPKAILCKNAVFLTSAKSEINHDTTLLDKYLNNPNPNNILIITAHKLDGKKNIAKLVKEKCQIVDSDVDLIKYIKNKTAGFKIDDETIRYLLLNTGSELTNIDNELDKLLAYKDQDKEILKSDIDLITIKKIDGNIYDLIDAIMNKDKKRSLKIYENIINYGEDIFKIFIALSNQIRLIYQVKVLKNLSNDDICNKLHLKNSKQVVALRYKIDKYNSSDLLDYLYRLSLMDEELKTGKSIDKIVFPIFIASL